MSMILNLSLPRGAATSTTSPFLRPMIALPTGDSFESLFSAGFASAEPTMWYSTVLFALTSRRRTFVPIETSPDLISFFVTTRAFLSRSSSIAMRASRWAWSFFAVSYSAFSAMSPNSRATRIRSAISRRRVVDRCSISSLSFLKPSGVRMTSFKADPPEDPQKNGRRLSRPAGADSTPTANARQHHPGTMPGRAGQPEGILVDSGGRGADPGRAGADGGRQRPGVPAPGPPLRSGPRLLGDGLLRRDRAPQRADARLPPGRRRRAPPRDPDLRLRARGDGGGGADGGSSRCRRHRHELRLPRAEGDEDRRGRPPAGAARPRVPDHRGRRLGGLGARDGEDAPRRRGRLACLPRARPCARRRRRLGARAAPALGPADVHRVRRPHAHRRARGARGRARDRLRRRHLACEGGERARRDRGGGGDGGPRRAGQ